MSVDATRWRHTPTVPHSFWRFRFRTFWNILFGPAFNIQPILNGPDDQILDLILGLEPRCSSHNWSIVVESSIEITRVTESSVSLTRTPYYTIVSNCGGLLQTDNAGLITWNIKTRLWLNCLCLFCLLSERCRLSPGPLLGCHSDDRLLLHGSAVVCGSYCHLHRSHRLPENGDPDVSSWGAAQVPGGQVKKQNCQSCVYGLVQAWAN